MDLILECQIGLYVTAILRMIGDMQEQLNMIEKMVATIKTLSDSD